MDDKKRKRSGETEQELAPILKKHVGLIHCENKLTFLQRKISNVFLYNALDKIHKEEIHQIPLKSLCSLIGYRSNDTNLIKKSIKTLISTIMEWNLLDDSKFLNEANLSPESISWNASSLLAGASIQRGIVRYSYSPQIKEVMSSVEIYGRINLFIQAKFNSAYSLVLYENCVRFKNIGRTSLFNLELFRALMGVNNGQYESFKELNRNVVTVALNEINQKSDIILEPEYQKSGRSVAGIRFLIDQNPKFGPTFKRIHKAAEKGETLYSSLLDILTEEFHFKDQAKDILNNYSDDYIVEKIDLVKKSKNVENASAYLMAALKNDYKQSKNELARIQKSREVKTTYLRETGEASQVRSLKKKYIEYKFSVYLKYLTEQENSERMLDEFLADLSVKNPVMGGLYKKKGLQSQPAMTEFIEYVDQHYAGKIEFLPFDEFLTEEEVSET